MHIRSEDTHIVKESNLSINETVKYNIENLCQFKLRKLEEWQVEKTFKIRITICNMAGVLGLGLLSVAIGMLLYYNFFEPKQFNSYQLIMRGSLCVAIPFITLYLITLREIRLEIKNEELYFYKNSKLFYRDNIQNLYSIRGLNTSIDKTRMIILNFERKKFCCTVL